MPCDRAGSASNFEAAKLASLETSPNVQKEAIAQGSLANAALGCIVGMAPGSGAATAWSPA